jgi:hypothetical protein
LFIVAAGREDVLSTRESALTDVSPVLPGSTAANAFGYMDGTVASAITALKTEVEEGAGVDGGLGFALQGSKPSYATADELRGLSSTKLPLPNPLAVVVPYRWAGRGELNMSEPEATVRGRYMRVMQSE